MLLTGKQELHIVAFWKKIVQSQFITYCQIWDGTVTQNNSKLSLRPTLKQKKIKLLSKVRLVLDCAIFSWHKVFRCTLFETIKNLRSSKFMQFEWWQDHQKTVQLKVLSTVHKSVYLKIFWTQLETLH